MDGSGFFVAWVLFPRPVVLALGFFQNSEPNLLIMAVPYKRNLCEQIPPGALGLTFRC